MLDKVIIKYKGRVHNLSSSIIVCEGYKETHLDEKLVPFRSPNLYAALFHQFHLQKYALEVLILVQDALLEQEKSIVIVDAYRDYMEQLKAHYRKPKLAIHPDQSKHPRGLAIDARLYDPKVSVIFDADDPKTWGDQADLTDTLTSYNWTATVKSEPWHYEFGVIL